MAREISIAISAKDNFTQAITTMRNANSSFNKDLSGTMQKLDALNKTKIDLKVDTDKAKNALKDAEKQFASTGSAADKMAVEIASANYDQARQNLDLVSKNARQAEKDILSMTDAVSKADNRAGSGKSGISSAMSAIAQAGFTKMIGDTASQMANTFVGSAYGSAAGTMFGSTLSGAASGAAMGSLINPGIGTAVGAAVGAGVGAINGAVQNFQKEDDAFKSVVQDSYNSAKQSQSDTLTSGISIASQREQDKISFTTLLKGSKNAGTFLSQVQDFADETPFEYDDLTKISKTMLAYGYKQNDILPLMTKVGDAGSALGMGKDDMNYVATSLGRMQNSGKTTLEYLNPLLERGVDVWKYLSEASGKTKEQVQDMVSKGLVPGAQAAKAIADYMGKDYKGSMDLQAKSYAGRLSSLEDAQNNVNAAMGKGFEDERKKGIQAQTEWLSGASGAKMQDAYSMIGTWQASLKNQEEELVRKAMDTAMNSAEYKTAKAADSQAEMGKILAEAQIKGENDYKKTDGYKLQVEQDKSLVQGIRDSMVADGIYKNYGYDMGIEFSKGMAETAQQGIKDATTPKGYTYSSASTSGIGTGGSRGSAPAINQYPGRAPGFATGVFRVPYNGYPAILHEGETVNTAVEARSNKANPQILITGNDFNVRNDDDPEKIARAIVSEIKKASLIT